MKRRALLGAAGALTCVVRAQDPARLRPLGFMRFSAPRENTQAEVRQLLGQLGHVDGQNVRIDFHWPTSTEQAERAAAQLVQGGAEVIMVADTPCAHAAARITRSVPIILFAVADPVGSGLVPSLARPGGNITGVSRNLPALAGKKLELLKEAAPRATRFAFLGSAQDPAADQFIGNTQEAARRIGVLLLPLRVAGPAGFAAAFQQMADKQVQALIVQPLFAGNYGAIADLAVAHRLPSMSDLRSFPESGGLLSYGPPSKPLWQRAAVQVDRILRGAKPADLPIEEPTVFELVANLKTARALGLSFPPSLLLRVDEVIE